jgi:ADP-heptose:LPS heptosyltransferase
MVISTKQDQRDSGSSEAEDFQIIVIKLPFDLQERLLTFPFLYALFKHYPESEFHFITPKKQIEVLNLLPFRAFYHEFDEDEIETVFDVHRFVHHARIRKTDIFISLTNSFVDACIGLSLKATQRVGFSDGWKTLVFNKKTKRPINHHICEDFFTLYQELTGQEADTRMKIFSRELEAVLPEWDSKPYLAINLAPLRGAAVEEEWIELISQFKNQRIILFFSEDQEKAQFLMDHFVARLTPANTYQNYIHLSWIELSKMLAFARGVITYSGAVASLATYVGCKTLVLVESEDPRRCGPFYFMGEVKLMEATQQQTSAASVLKPRARFNMPEVASAAWDFFKLSI